MKHNLSKIIIKVTGNLKKDTWTEPKGDRIKGGSGGGWGQGERRGDIWRQLHLNKNFKM